MDVARPALGVDTLWAGNCRLLRKKKVTVEPISRLLLTNALAAVESVVDGW
jgi:hypothetical protein